MRIKLPDKENCKFVLLGAGYHLCRFLELLNKRNYPKPIIITWPKELHQRDIRLLNDERLYLNVFEHAEKYDIKIIETENLNDPELLSSLVREEYNIAFSLSWRYLIRKEFIITFEERVFNIHPTLLPQERGAGTFTYRILNDSKLIATTIHKIDEKFDTGPIVLQLQTELNKSNPIPYDYLVETNKLYDTALLKFLEKLERDRTFELIAQDESRHSYYARLHTETNGAINWDWSISEIEKFIRAFSDPYPGAFTFINEKRVVIHQTHIKHNGITHHPFLSGRILSINSDGTVDILVKDGILTLDEISIESRRIKPAQLLKATNILYTPHEILDSARSSIIGVKEMK